VKPNEKLPFLSFDVSRWVAMTIGLTLEERGALTTLRDAAWLRNGRLPNQPTAIARLLGLSAEHFEQIWPSIAGWFESAGDGSMYIPELEVERRRALDLLDKRRRGAEKTNAEYWPTRRANKPQSESLSDPQSGPQSGSQSDPLTDSHSGPHSDTDSESLAGRTHTDLHPDTQTHNHTHSPEGGERGGNRIGKPSTRVTSLSARRPKQPTT